MLSFVSSATARPIKDHLIIDPWARIWHIATSTLSQATTLLKYLQISIFVLLSACSFVRFEVSPYVVRDVEIYYSEQEDVTFFFWKIRQEALLDKVSFEQFQNSDYREIRLDDALFPAAPFQCGNHWCFQYQQTGKYENVLEPIRSVHSNQGVFAGTKPRLETVGTTFGSEPIGIDNNNRIDPHLYDWFGENKVVLKRGFEWQFRDPGGNDCGAATQPWASFSGEIDSKHDWVESASAACFALRPKRIDGRGAEVLIRLPASAETTFEKQRYDAATEIAHAVYGVLVDMEIPNDQRCNQIKDWLASTIEGAIASNSESHTLLGIYTPLSTVDGESLSGCEQRNQQDFPLAKMIQDARSELSLIEKPVRVIWIYVNNIDQAPADRVLTQIVGLQTALSNSFLTYNLAIGSDFIIQYFQQDSPLDVFDEDPDGEFDLNPFKHGIGWRPIEDATFGADIRSWAKANLPFHTMIHNDRTEIPIKKWTDAADAKRFKICQATPFEVDLIGLKSPLFQFTRLEPSLVWPDDQDPFFSVRIDPQILLPKNAYRLQRVDTVIEACLRFCDARFQTQSREVFQSWSQTPGERAMEICQWTE